MGDALLPLIVLGWVAYRVFRWWLFPGKVCGKCHGEKELKDGRNRRDCPKCHKTGRVPRVGRSRS